MDIAVVSDVHGNCVALDAVLTALRDRPVDGMVCLGDAVQGGVQPREVIERLAGNRCPVILGNADAFVLDAQAGGEGTSSDRQLAVREWTVEQLGRDGMDFVRTFVPTHELPLPRGRRFLCFHGSPRSYNEVLLPDSPDASLDDALATSSAALLAGGHTHLQWSRALGSRTYFNPGSVGLAYSRFLSRDAHYFYDFAEYAVVHATDGHIGIEFCQAPFDVADLERAALASGHPFAEGEAARYRRR